MQFYCKKIWLFHSYSNPTILSDYSNPFRIDKFHQSCPTLNGTEHWQKNYHVKSLKTTERYYNHDNGFTTTTDFNELLNTLKKILGFRWCCWRKWGSFNTYWQLWGRSSQCQWRHWNVKQYGVSCSTWRGEK